MCFVYFDFSALFQIRELVPESQAYMDLLAFERKLDQTIMRKRLDIQEALKRPIKVLLDLLLTLSTFDLSRRTKLWSFMCLNSVCSVCSMQQKRKLRIFISNTFNPAKADAEDGEGTVASWELRVEGRLLEDVRFCHFSGFKGIVHSTENSHSFSLVWF